MLRWVLLCYSVLRFLKRTFSIFLPWFQTSESLLHISDLFSDWNRISERSETKWRFSHIIRLIKLCCDFTKLKAVGSFSWFLSQIEQTPFVYHHFYAFQVNYSTFLTLVCIVFFSYSPLYLFIGLILQQQVTFISLQPRLQLSGHFKHKGEMNRQDTNSLYETIWWYSLIISYIFSSFVLTCHIILNIFNNLGPGTLWIIK